MKKLLVFLFTISIIVTTSCSRVAPNYYGVLMENYGKNGKSDYSKQQGKVSTWGPGTELFQVPAWEQRAEFLNDSGDGSKRLLHLKSSNNTEFTASPMYSYKAIEASVVDLVFQNSRLGSGDDFMRALENNVLEPRIYDLIKEESRKYTSDSLMATGGNLQFEESIQKLIKDEFAKSGLELITFSVNLEFSDKVRQKIDTRNEVNTNISVLDQQITEQKKRNELAALKAEENRILSEGLTDQVLTDKFIEKWDGKSTLYALPPALMKPVK